MRKYYLDNIRWATVLLVIVYHIFYVFNSVGVLGGIGRFNNVQYQDAVLYFIYPWFMVLLFLIAGMSAKYALEKQSTKEFFAKRTWKLLVPSTLGLLVFQWIVGYFNIKIGGGLEYIPSFMVYPISALSGTGPLWFIQTLWLFSLLLLLLRMVDKNEMLWKLGGKCNTIIVLLLGLLILGGAQILNMPVITVYRFGIYFVAFLLGYYVFSHDEITDKLKMLWLPLAVIALAMGIAYTVYYFGQNYTDDSILRNVYTNTYAWVMCLAILAVGKRFFDKQNKFTVYMTKSSFGFYILHYIFVLIPCYYLKTYLSVPQPIIYIVAILIAFICTAVTYEIMRRIPFVRCLVLGIRRKKNDKG